MKFLKSWLPLITLAFASVSFAQTQTDSQEFPTTSAGATVARQQAFERLRKEISDLIPGDDYPADSKESKALDDVVYGFMSGNQGKISESLSALIQLDPKIPPRELLLAGMAFAANNPVGGKTLLEQAAVRHRDHPGIPLAFARLALVQGRYFDAMACVEKARATNNQSTLNEDVKKYYEISCLDTMTIIEIRRNELAPAERFARQWQQLDPSSDKMLLASGEVRFLQEKIDDAVSFLNQRSDATKVDAPTELIMAKWYQAKNDEPNFGKWMADAYAENPSNPLTQLEYAAWKIRGEDFDNAASVVADYEQSNGESAQSKLIKGRVAFAKEDFEAAEKYFTELLTGQPGNFENAYFLVLALLESENPAKRKQAVDLARQAFQNYRNNQLSASVLGWALYKTDNKAVGSELLLKARNIGQLLPDTAYFLANVMADDQRTAQAKRLLLPYIETPAVFIFRQRAKALLKELGSDDDLPVPGGN